MTRWRTADVRPTYRCNAAQMKHFRERRRFTQDELARRSGYTVRLISKAESGRSVSSDTVEDIAEALSTEEEPVYPEDLISDPVQFARLWIEATYRDGVDAHKAVAGQIDPDAVLVINGDPTQIPFAGEYRGPEGFREMLGKFFAVLECPPGHDPTPHYHFIGAGNEVIVWGRSWLHPIGRPMDEPIDVSIRMQFSRGKLVRFEDRFDTQAGGKVLADAGG